MDILDFINDNDKKEIVVKIIAPKFEEMGFKLITKLEYDLLSKRTVLPSKQKRKGSYRVTVNGREYESKTDFAKAIGISQAQLYVRLREGETLDDLDNSFRLKHQTVDENGNVTEIRKRKAGH